MRWLRRNAIALVLIVVSGGLIGGTVTYPSWARYLGHSRPEITVQSGQAAEIGDAQWRLREVTVPHLPGSPTPPADSRFVAFVIDREAGGKPTALPAEFADCFAALQSGDRNWSAQSLPDPVRSWAQQQGYVIRCGRPGPLFVGMYVPEDAALDAVDVHFRNRTDPGAPPSRAPGGSFTDLRFTLR